MFFSNKYNDDYSNPDTGECKPVVGNWNVISEDEFKSRIETVFDMVATSLANTLGPYGSTTIIEKFGEMYVTKDGFNVLKSIHFDKSIDNNILAMLIRIAQQIVLKVGDGSTSSIVAANSILKRLNADKNLINSMRPKEFIDALNFCVKIISESIINNAKKVNTETFDEIYRLAYISTNGNETIAEMIQEIYKKTNNPSIEYVKAKDDITRYEVIDGYKSDITYLDTIFANHDDGTCTIDKPYLLLFNYKIDTEKSYEIISEAVKKAVGEGRRLVVIAPNYDKFLMEAIRQNVTLEFKTMGTSSIVYCRVPLVSNISHDLYNDFSVMCGATTITESVLDNFKLEETWEYVGAVEKMTIGPKTTTIEGFTNRNQTMYEKVVNDAVAKYNAKELEARERSIIDTKLNELKQRVSKLQGSMGVIYVGGYTSIEKGANFDLVEDAVKACESAYANGYNCGGSLVIPFTINKILKCSDKLSDEIIEIFELLSESFKDVFRCVIANKYKDVSSDIIAEKYIEECISDDDLVCVDISGEDTFTDTVINSCITDVEILKATVSIISLLISSNQYISIEASK